MTPHQQNWNFVFSCKSDGKLRNNPKKNGKQNHRYYALLPPLTDAFNHTSHLDPLSLLATVPILPAKAKRSGQLPELLQ
jgi:hypothetical protein